jgi:hypothetical protein
MKRAILFVVLMLGMTAFAGDKPKGAKDEAKPEPPTQLKLTADQSKALADIDASFKELERQAREQSNILEAQRMGLLQAFTLGSPLAGKQCKIVTGKDGGTVLEEITTVATQPAQITTAGGTQPAAAGAQAPGPAASQQPLRRISRRVRVRRERLSQRGRNRGSDWRQLGSV